jgi:hypothetical protein
MMCPFVKGCNPTGDHQPNTLPVGINEIPGKGEDDLVTLEGQRK